MRYLFVTLMAFTLMACGEEEFTMGSEFFDGTSFQLNSWDTLTMEFSTVRLDSIITSYPSQLVVGSLSHEVFGEATASSYFQVSPDTSSFVVDPDEVRYDSVTLVLSYNSYYYGDTTQQSTLEVYELSEDISLNDETLDLYNTSSFRTHSDPIGTTVVTPRPFTGDDIEIRLNDELGLRFFEEAEESDNAFNNQSEFLDYFKGLMIKASADNAVIGFDNTPEIRLYYSDLTQIPAEQRYLSIINTETLELSFSHFDSDFTSSVLNQLPPEGDSALSSTYTNNEAYLQSGAGLALRIEIPHIRKIIEDNPDMLIDEVLLRLKPVNGQYDNDRELIEQLRVYYVDHKNRILGTLNNLMILTLDEEFDLDTYYEMDIKSFVEYQLEEDEYNNNALLITASGDVYNSTVHHLTIGDQHHENFKSEIKLNLIELKE